MTAAADTTEIMALFSNLEETAKRLTFSVIQGLAAGRLSCDEVADATARMQAGDNKLEALIDLVQLSNERLIEAADGEVVE